MTTRLQVEVNCDSTCEWRRCGLRCPNCLADERAAQRGWLDGQLTAANRTIHELTKKVKELKPTAEHLDGSCQESVWRRGDNCYSPFDFLSQARGAMNVQELWWKAYTAAAPVEAELRQAEALIQRGSVVAVSLEFNALCEEDKLLRTHCEQLRSFMDWVREIVVRSERDVQDQGQILERALNQLELINARLVRLAHQIAAIGPTVPEPSGNGDGATTATHDNGHDAGANGTGRRNGVLQPAPP